MDFQSRYNFNQDKIISVVGNDFKSQDLKLLESCGVDISGIKIEENDTTGDRNSSKSTRSI